jgi:hypothetical protein
VQKELKSRQICLFIIALLPLYKLFMMPSVLAAFSYEDAWISALFNFALDFITIFFIVRFMKKTDTDFFTVLENTLGKTVSKIIMILYLIYFSLKAIIPLNEQKDYVELTLYTLMPTMLYFLPFFLFAFYLCTKKLRAIGRAADVLWLTTILGFLILFSLSISNSDLGAILPVFARGLPAICRGSISTLTWFGDGAYLLFFVGEFTYKKMDGIKILCAHLICCLFVVMFLIIFYSVFTSISFRQRFALTEISKYTTVINNIGRFDYLGIIMLLFGNLFTMTLPLFFSCRLLNRIFNIKKSWVAPTFIVLLQVVIMTVFYQYLHSIENIVMNYLGIFFLILGNVLPIIISLFAQKGVRYESAQC